MAVQLSHKVKSNSNKNKFLVNTPSIEIKIPEEPTVKNDISEEMGLVLKLLRERLNFSQIDLAERLSVTSNYISLLEKGKRVPSMKFLENVANELNVSVSQIFKASENLAKDLKLKEAINFFTIKLPENFEKILYIAKKIEANELLKKGSNTELKKEKESILKWLKEVEEKFSENKDSIETFLSPIEKNKVDGLLKVLKTLTFSK